MKNIHVLKTDKPSRLLKDLVDGTYQFKKEVLYGNWFELPLSIYITNDEEIKEGDWVYSLREGFEPILKQKVNTIGVNNDEMMKKIILTTDQDLIEDGVQAIDDEFLEWFVKNPSCEEVEIIQMCRTCDAEGKEGDSYCQRSKECNRGWAGEKYKIIIPKEEPKNICIQTGLPCGMQCLSEEACNSIRLKQETLEEASEQYAKSKSSSTVFQKAHIRDFISGAKWQQERIPIIIKEFLEQYGNNISAQLMQNDVEEWFEQFKNK